MSDESEDQWLSGCPISQELEVSQLSGTDSFLVSVPTNGKLESNFWRSRRVSYDTIRDDIYAGLFGNIGLGSMASADVSAYAPRSHAHFGRYSIVSVEQHYHRNPMSNQNRRHLCQMRNSILMKEDYLQNSH